MTEEAWIDLDLWVASLPVRNQEYIEKNIRLGDYTDMEREYFATLKLLEGFFDIPESIIGDDPANLAAYRKYIKAPDLAQGGMESNNPNLTLFRTLVDQERLNARKTDPRIDAAHAVWFGGSPVGLDAKFTFMQGGYNALRKLVAKDSPVIIRSSARGGSR
jgi:hypothetical protein